MCRVHANCRDFKRLHAPWAACTMSAADKPEGPGQPTWADFTPATCSCEACGPAPRGRGKMNQTALFAYVDVSGAQKLCRSHVTS